MFLFIRERLCMQEVASVPFNAPAAARKERAGNRAFRRISKAVIFNSIGGTVEL